MQSTDAIEFDLFLILLTKLKKALSFSVFNVKSRHSTFKVHILNECLEESENRSHQRPIYLQLTDIFRFGSSLLFAFVCLKSMIDDSSNGVAVMMILTWGGAG